MTDLLKGVDLIGVTTLFLLLPLQIHALDFWISS